MGCPRSVVRYAQGIGADAAPLAFDFISALMTTKQSTYCLIQCFFLYPSLRPTCPGIAMLTVGWVLLHQSTTKKMLHKSICSQSDGEDPSSLVCACLCQIHEYNLLHTQTHIHTHTYVHACTCSCIHNTTATFKVFQDTFQGGIRYSSGRAVATEKVSSSLSSLWQKNRDSLLFH